MSSFRPRSTFRHTDAPAISCSEPNPAAMGFSPATPKPISSVVPLSGCFERVGRKEHGGEFAGFSAGNAEAQCVAGKAWMKPVLAVQGDDLGRHFRPVFRVSKIMDEKKVAFEAAGIESAKQGGDNSGLEIQAFPERPFFKLGGRTGEAFAEK